MTNSDPYRAPADASDEPQVETGDRENLRNVATYHRYVIFCILANIAVWVVGKLALDQFAGNEGGTIVARLAVIVVAIVVVIETMSCVFKLSSALKTGTAGFNAFAMIIPCLSIIVLLILSQQATNYLKQRGIKVGILGANPASI